MKRNRIYVIITLILSFIAVILSGILIDDNTIFYIDTIEILFLIGILGSTSYSGIIMLDSYYYQLCFGMTRKKIFIKYIKDILLVMWIIILYSTLFFITKFIINKNTNSLYKLLDMFSYIEIYIFANAIAFILGSYMKNKYLILFFSVICVGLVVLKVFEKIGLYNILLLIIGLIIYYFGYRYQINKKIIIV